MRIRRREAGKVDTARAICAADPVAAVLVAERLTSAASPPAQLWFWPPAEPTAVAWSGANIVPVMPNREPAALDDFADRALAEGRRCSSITGDSWAVLGLWERLAPAWGSVREVRPRQPSMVIDAAPAAAPDPLVRFAVAADLPDLLPACVAMFTEEVGYSPLTGAPGTYEARIRSLVESRRSLVRMGPDGVEFKAEVGALGLGVAQIQGVWVPPHLRGQGRAIAGMAAVVTAVRAEIAPLVSLYVNDFNIPAVAAYRRVGFRQVGEYATVLF